MNDFDYDCAQKKRIAKSAHNHVNARRGKCKLPHEYLTRKELNALNGKVKSYDLGKPMDLDTFRAMPDDLKKQYIEDLQERFHANDGMLAEMLGCSRQNVLFHRRRLGIKGFPRGSTPEEEHLKAWKTWMGENEEQMDPPVAETPGKRRKRPSRSLPMKWPRGWPRSCPSVLPGQTSTRGRSCTRWPSSSPSRTSPPA